MSLEFDKEYRISQLIAKAMTEGLSEGEKAELDRWRLSSGDSGSEERLYHLITDPQNREKRDEEVKKLSISAAWFNLERKIGTISNNNIIRLKKVISIAAVIALLTGMFFIYTFTKETTKSTNTITMVEAGSSKAYLITNDGKHISLVQPDHKELMLHIDNGYVLTTATLADFYSTKDSLKGKAEKQIVHVPRGGEYELVLSDRTHIWLNSDSEIHFPTVFNSDIREIFLKGEAYLEVFPDKNSPFIIHTIDNLKVEVLGTSFNIQAYAEENLITTTLNSGSVRVSDGKNEVILSPNHQAIYDSSNGSLDSRQVNASIYSAWKSGMFIFENQPLGSILRTLSRWYDIEVDAETIFLDNYHFTGDLERYTDFRKTLQMIERATPDIHFIIKGRTVFVEEVSNI